MLLWQTAVVLPSAVTYIVTSWFFPKALLLPRALTGLGVFPAAAGARSAPCTRGSPVSGRRTKDQGGQQRRHRLRVPPGPGPDPTSPPLPQAVPCLTDTGSLSRPSQRLLSSPRPGFRGAPFIPKTSSVPAKKTGQGRALTGRGRAEAMPSPSPAPGARTWDEQT